jgi:hypothetical protein
LYRAFVSSILVPRDWKEALNDPNWKFAMVEEINVLAKNDTWKLTTLRAGKKIMG